MEKSIEKTFSSGADVPLPEDKRDDQKQKVTGNPPITSRCGCLIFRETFYFVKL